jgi:hypothetical protein
MPGVRLSPPHFDPLRAAFQEVEMLIRTVVYALGKPLAALLLGGVILSQVIARLGAADGRAIVHVAMAPVDVNIDGTLYHVGSLFEPPVVCDLRPGRHSLQMFSQGCVVYQQEFLVAAGEDVVLAAWDESAPERRQGPRPVTGSRR